MNKMCRTTNQSGRSMIEMLGVLAIIGVLSVGGIAGYSKAMMKFKINKTIDQVTQLSQNIRTLYAKQKNYASLSHKVIRKANLAPSELFIDTDSDYKMTNAFGGEFIVLTGFGLKTQGDYKDFMFVLDKIPEDACIELLTHDWGSGAYSGLVAIAAHGISDNDNTYLGCSGINGDSETGIACPQGSVVSIPMPVDIAVNICSDNRNGQVGWKFY